MRVAAQFPVDDRLALGFRQRGQCGHQGLELLPALDFALGGQAGQFGAGQLGMFVLLPVPDLVQGGVADDPVEPGPRLLHLFCRHCPMRLDQGILDHVLGPGRADDRRCESGEGGPVALDKLVEGRVDPASEEIGKSLV